MVANDQCEIHFWPARKFWSATRTKTGISDSISYDGLRHRTPEELRSDLSEKAQLEAIRNMGLPTLLNMRNPALVAEPGDLSKQASLQSDGRMTESSSACYAEIAVGEIDFISRHVGRDYLRMRLVLRTYKGSGAVPTISRGYAFSDLRIYPAKIESQKTAALDELRSSFGAGIEKFIRNYSAPSSRGATGAAVSTPQADPLRGVR